jgi:sugar phosphate isomerase/epimerase
MQLGLCAHPADLAALHELPFDFIEGHVQDFLKPGAPEAEFAASAAAARASRLPMPAANCFLPASISVTGTSVDREKMARYGETAFSRAAAVGLTTIVFGSAAARQMPDGWPAGRGFEQYVDALSLLAPLAQKHGVMLLVEPLNRGECNLINTVEEGAEAVRRCGHPHVRLLVDIFHMLRNGEKPNVIARNAELIVHAHLAENEGRTAPGVHGDDFRAFLRALKKAVRCQRLTLECVWQKSMAVEAAPAFAALRQQLTESGF